MMLRGRSIALCICLVSMVFLASCEYPDSETIGSGAVRLSVDIARERTIAPSGDLIVLAGIRVTASEGPEGSSDVSKDFGLGEDIVLQGLVVGTWKLAVEGLNGDGEVVTDTSEQTVTIVSGQRTNASFVLVYKGGTGQVTLDLSFPSELNDKTSLKISLLQDDAEKYSQEYDATPTTGTVTWSNVPVGDYELRLVFINKLSGTEVSLAMWDMVNVYSGRESRGDVSLTEEMVEDMTIASPEISTSEASITIEACNADISVLYAVDAGTYQAYAGTFELTRSSTVEAVATKAQCFDSDPATKTVVLYLQAPKVQAADVVGGKTITLISEDGAPIYYTLDGTTPTAGSACYSTAIKLDTPGSHTVKAIAIKDGYTDSAISTEQYSIPEASISFEITNSAGKTRTVSTVFTNYTITVKTIPTSASISYNVTVTNDGTATTTGTKSGKTVTLDSLTNSLSSNVVVRAWFSDPAALTGYAMSRSTLPTSSSTAVSTSKAVLPVWTKAVQNGTVTWNALAASSSALVMVGESGDLSRSTNGGSTWSTSTVGQVNWMGIGVSGSTFVAVEYSYGYRWTRSTDNGTTWSTPARNGSVLWRAAAGSGRTWVMVGFGGGWSRSTDGGATWSTPQQNGTVDWGDVAVVGNTWIMVGASKGYGYWSRSTDNGATWSTPKSSGAGGLWFAKGRGSTWIMAGSNGYWSRSTDGGATWSTPQKNGDYTWTGVCAAGNKTWMMVGTDGSWSRSSDDGVTWSTPRQNEIDSVHFYEVVYTSNGNFVAVMRDGYWARTL